MSTRSSEAALVLVTGLRAVITVIYVPLAGNVAQLDTTTSVWLLELDSDSPDEDHCWAMIDVLRVMCSGVQAAESARTSPRLRLVETNAPGWRVGSDPDRETLPTHPSRGPYSSTVGPYGLPGAGRHTARLAAAGYRWFRCRYLGKPAVTGRRVR